MGGEAGDKNAESADNWTGGVRPVMSSCHLLGVAPQLSLSTSLSKGGTSFPGCHGGKLPWIYLHLDSPLSSTILPLLPSRMGHPPQ